MEPFNLYMFQYNLIPSSTSKVGKAKDHIYFYIKKEDFFLSSLLLYYQHNDLNVYVISCL